MFVPHQTPSCSAAWEEETGSWRAPREDFLLLKKKGKKREWGVYQGVGGRWMEGGGGDYKENK